MKTEMTTIQAPINWEAELLGAKMLIASKLIPKDIQTPEAALFCILAGRDLGLSPVQSLRSIRPIQGKIECSADLQLGLFHRNGGKSRWLKLDATGAELELSASWLSQPHVSKFGPEEAKRAELMSNANYRKYPQAMFRSRAITQGLKDIGFLIGAGVYAPGELGGEVVVAEDGEVLPSTMAQQENITSGTHTGTDGAVEALVDEEREFLEGEARDISVFVTESRVSSAHERWKKLDSDEKVAVWAMIDKPVKKALKEADAAAKATVVTSPIPTVDDALKAIKNGDMDLAADISRGLSDEDKAFVTSEIAARAAK